MIDASENDLAGKMTKPSKKLVTVADEYLELLGRLEAVQKRSNGHVLEALCGGGADVSTNMCGLSFYCKICLVFACVSQADSSLTCSLVL